MSRCMLQCCYFITSGKCIFVKIGTMLVVTNVCINLLFISRKQISAYAVL